MASKGKGKLKEKVIKPPSFDTFVEVPFEPNFVDNKQCEERKKGYYLTCSSHPSSWWSSRHWTWIIPIFSISPKSDYYYM
jgi:hypothetical protein